MANVVMHNLNNWLNDYKLLKSIGKICYAVFTPSKIMVDYEFDIIIENSQNQKVAFCKYLEIFVNRNLSILVFFID
jgi:hypothetical protein